MDDDEENGKYALRENWSNAKPPLGKTPSKNDLVSD